MGPGADVDASMPLQSHLALLCRGNHKSGAWKMHANLADLTTTASDHDLSSWNASPRKLLQSDPLVNEQPALPADAAAVSGKTSISADDPVARNHNGNRVCSIGQADRA